MSQTEKYQVGDLIIYETPQEFCRETKTIEVASGAEVVVGEMFEDDSGDADKKKLATDGNADCVCLENYKNTTAAAVTRKVVCLVRGTAILKYGILSGGTVKATAVAALIAAMGNTITRTEAGG